MQPFTTIQRLPIEMIDNLNSLNYENMTQIQQRTIPAALERRDIVAQAKTGSGKTAAFGIPLIMGINTANRDPQALIMTPTRELADQVGKELRRLARYRENIKIVILTGGVPMRGQIASLQKGAHIVVGTPGRLQDHLSRDTIPLYDINRLVLDEADRMLDMGFYDEITKIISNLPKQRQTMLFSATFPDKIEKLTKSVLKNPEIIKVEDKHSSDTIKEIAYSVDPKSKNEMLLQVLKSYQPISCLIFSNMKETTETVADYLNDHGFLAQALNGNLEQREREEVLLMFANASVPLLVATDVASRGLDVKDIELVINYDLPFDPEVYTHRIGRTGRAGASGTAITLFTPAQREKLENISTEIIIGDQKEMRADKRFSMHSHRVTICIDGGKKAKLRAGDILGTLCKDIGIDGKDIGKIDIHERRSYVALDLSVAKKALDGINRSRIKKRKFRAWKLKI